MLISLLIKLRFGGETVYRRLNAFAVFKCYVYVIFVVAVAAFRILDKYLMGLRLDLFGDYLKLKEFLRHVRVLRAFFINYLLF